MLMFHCSLLWRRHSTECVPDLLGMVDKRGEVTISRVERCGAMRQSVRKQTSRSRRHHPVLLPLPEEEGFKCDRFEGYAPGLTIHEPIFCRSVCSLSKALSRSLGKCLSDRLML